MKGFITLISILLCASSSYAQTRRNTQQTQKTSPKVITDSLLRINNSWLEQIDFDISLKQRYKLYQTENTYIFLELDTKTGIIKQVQLSLDSNNEGCITINNEDLTYGLGYGSGSFELYPTKNMFLFILLDKTNGRKWHVQWGMETANRWIRRIL
jgi:hypothetical protein